MKEFKVGDKVWSVQLGECEVKVIDGEYKYLVGCMNDEGSIGYYTLDGKHHYTDKNPSLFHEKPDCFKRKVKKSIERWANKYNTYTSWHSTKEEADENRGYGRIACVKLTGEYEVEE